jgi:pimeloyl-ACP methyl ester carboxylesterase
LNEFLAALPAVVCVGALLRDLDLRGRIDRGDQAEEFATKVHNVVRWSEFGRGGHFAALEAPEGLAVDVREFFRSVSRA